MMVAQQSNTVALGQLLAGLELAVPDKVVTGIQLDSRRVLPGDLFLACAGHQHDGRAFIDEAISAGATAVFYEADESSVTAADSNTVPVVAVENLSQRLSALAGAFYGEASLQLPVLAVTGTNGKTSCTLIIQQLLNSLGKRCGLIGTLGAGVDGQLQAGLNTTPDALQIQRLLAQWYSDGVDVAAMEVSSHGIEQHRVDAVHFAAAVFTNLTRDHLDYHGSMAAYGAAKAKLFAAPGLPVAVLNFDDGFAIAQRDQLSVQTAAYSYSLRDSAADIWVDDICYDSHGLSARLHSPWGELPLVSPLLGAFNLSNLLAAVGVLAALGYELPALLATAASLEAVPGRMERIASAADVDVVIDYAHTPDALQNALQAMRLHTRGRLYCVFGCGGDRDRGKRPQMGAIAERFADEVLVTSDNPRGEDMAAIIEDIVAGMNSTPSCEPDRRRAIAETVAAARAGDSILIAGKGHENYQQIADQRLPFSDFDEARKALLGRSKGGDS